MQVRLQIGALLSRLSPGKGERIKVRGLDNYWRLRVEPHPPPLPRQGEASLSTRDATITRHSKALPSTAELNSHSCIGQLNQ